MIVRKIHALADCLCNRYRAYCRRTCHPPIVHDGKEPMCSVGTHFQLSWSFVDPPDELPCRFGHSRGTFCGKQLQGKQMGTFLWVQLPKGLRAHEVLYTLNKHGDVPPGQWLEAIYHTFQPNGSRAVMDPSWIMEMGAGLPCIGPRGRMHMLWARARFDKMYWLVQVS